ncbi:MAG: CvpA family protein [Chlorobi bacterium]|nr:CvpA family protein [Chlorobiota bacterium]
MTINTLDLIILIPLLLWAWQGYKKGLIISVASLAALVLGLYFAFYFSDYTAGQLKKHFDISPEYMAIVSFIVTFIVVVVAVVLVGRLLHKFVDVLMLGNKAAGLVFGVLKGALYLSILIFLINYFDPGEHLIKKEYKQGSLLYTPVASFAPLLYSRLNLDNLDIHIPTKGELLDKVY